MSVRGDVTFRLHQYRFAMSVYSGTSIVWTPLVPSRVSVKRSCMLLSAMKAELIPTMMREATQKLVLCVPVVL